MFTLHQTTSLLTAARRLTDRLTPGAFRHAPKIKKLGRLLGSVSSVLLLSACASGLPKGITPVQNFEVDRYLGIWYEIARLDHRFERGLTNVSAEYSLKDNGQIRVLNKGRDENGEWSEAEGRAKFAREKDEGYLKVSFFGPFFGTYAVFNLDEDYSQAYVAGDDRSYLWFLSRTPTVNDEQKQAFVDQAKALGFPVDELIFVDQGLGDRL